MIDLRSDTVTRPTPAMREAIAAAEVGDDALGDDPTVRRLEERIAGLLDKEAAVLFPSGIMANQTALLLHTTPGTEVVLEATAHILDWEAGAAAHWSGVQLRPVATPDGLLTPERVEAAIRPRNPYQIQTSLIAVENTHNAAGGRILPLDAMRGIRSIAEAHGLPVHLDGARLWNASAETGIPESDYAAQADTVTVSLSKGLGAPVGSLLAGTAKAIGRARALRRRLGGSMRQAGILAAAGLHALDHHRRRLREDHERARLLARKLEEVEQVRVVPPETNIVMIDLLPDAPDAAAVVERLGRRGVLTSAFGPRRVRAITHLDVDDAGVEAAAAAIADVVRG